MSEKRFWTYGFAVFCAACASESAVTEQGPLMNRGARSGVAAASVPSTGRAGMSAPLPTGEVGLAGMPGWIVDSGPPADTHADCAATSVTAPPPSKPAVDIIWVVDASGSMLDEQKKIGMNLTQFADLITKSNIDVRIVMMTTSTSTIPGVCPLAPPDPLSGTALAGDPRYKFLDSRVDSYNLLDVAVANFPMYQNFLRSGATTHLITVSDDESTYKGMATPQERAQGFYNDMKMLLGHDFLQHTISSEGPAPCGDPNCMREESTDICVLIMLSCGAARPGDTYYALAGMTQGLTSSICLSEWTPIFARLGEAVIKSVPLPCEYTIPPPPVGQNLDPLKVNVGYTAPGSSETLFRKAPEQTACGDELGWFYDDPAQPKQLKLCPASCKQVAAGGTVSIAFGCETIVLI